LFVYGTQPRRIVTHCFLAPYKYSYLLTYLFKHGPGRAGLA